MSAEEHGSCKYFIKRLDSIPCLIPYLWYNNQDISTICSVRLKALYLCKGSCNAILAEPVTSAQIPTTHVLRESQIFLLFTILISDMRVSILNGSYITYADDTNLYWESSVDNINNTITNANNVLENVRSYCVDTCLRLNVSTYFSVPSQQLKN